MMNLFYFSSNKTLAIILLILVSHPIVYCETIAEVNSNVYFKPKLDYFSKEKTGLSILVLHKENEITINNPFFSKSGYYLEDLKGYNKYKLHTAIKTYLPNHHGKINLAPFPKGQHDLKLSWPNGSIQLSPTIKDQSISLQLLILPQENFAPILGEYQIKTVLNLGYKKIYKCLTQIKKLILKVKNKRFKVENHIDKSYRDDLGKAKDFIAYLKIQYSKLEHFDVSMIKVKLLDKTYVLELQGKTKFANTTSTDFNYQMNLNYDFEIISYQNLNEAKD